MKHQFMKEKKLGFTLTELLAVLAILAVLIGLGVTGFVSFRRNITITEYDDLAREIYVAAQNQLTRLDANGMHADTVKELETGTPITQVPSDYIKGEAAWPDDFYYAQNGSPVMEVLLPLGAVAEDVHSNGFYAIEYNVKTRTVYSVFYSESNFEYTAVSTKPEFRTSKEVRKENMVGYYGGSAVERDPVTHCETPQLQIINNNELRLNILNVPTEGSFSVTISDGTNDVKVSPDQIQTWKEADQRTVLLDGMDAGEHFHEQFSSLTPGKDLTITVTYEKAGSISSSASVTANSLFATREGTNGEVVTLAYARHLQNLENSVSHLDDSSITTARQTEHIQWEDGFDPFVSIKNEGVNENLKCFEGSNLEIRELKGSNGLFAQTKEGMVLSGIRIVNPVIDTNGTDPVGALAGTAAPDTEINMCWVYSSKLKDDGTIDYGAIQNCHVDGLTTTGGLVGKATNTIVAYSFAALPSIQGTNGAGLIGEATGCDISNSYASCDNLPKNFCAFLVKGEAADPDTGKNTITHCYAVGNMADPNPCYFINNVTDAVGDCYFAVSHRVFAEKWEDNVDLAATDFYYIEDGTWTSSDQEKLQNAAGSDGWAKDWAKMIAPLSHPYREYLEGQPFPYPAITELDHYGSWPDDNGKVTLTINMALLSQEGAYALEAGRVVVRDEEGNELFDSEKHKKVEDGIFDGENAVQVVPGAKVTFEITPAEGYEYLYTNFNGKKNDLSASEGEETVTLDYTVDKDTVADVTFRQKAFTLTGVPAVDESGESKIAGANYDIDLTSPVKTLNIANDNQSAKVETGSKVTVRPKTPATYSGCVIWYAPKGNNAVENRTYLTQDEDGSYTFTMPAKDTDLHVMYTQKEAFFKIEYYLMDTEGKYPETPHITENYKCGLGSQINQSMINTMAESSGLPLTIDGERVRYLAEAKVTSHKNNDQDVVFHSRLDENGKVTSLVGAHVTKEGETNEKQPYQVKIYIARKEYTVTLTAEEHVSGVRFGGETGDYQKTVTDTFRYGATVKAQAQVEPGYSFTYWDPQDSRFMMSAEEEYTFQVPQYDLNLKAIAASDRHLVTINLMENDESWLYSSRSRQADPITLTLVNSKDPTKTYLMQPLTDESNSYAMQAVVPSIQNYEEGYYVRVDYASGLSTWLYTYGSTGDDGTGGTDAQNTLLKLRVRNGAVERTARFYSVTYHPNKQKYIGSVPKGGTYPKYYHLTVEGNTGLLRNLTDEKKIFSGWKDYYALGTGSDTTYAGKEILMVTRRTDLFAQWVESLAVTYHSGEADGGQLPVDTYEYQPGQTVHIQWGSLTRKGYSFIGWSTNPNAEVPEFSEGKVETCQMGTNPLDLYPVWKKTVFTVQFYDADGNPLDGEQYSRTNVISGTEIEIPDFGVTEGTFLGWTNKDGTVLYRYRDTLTVTEDIELYPCVAKNAVTVTLKDGEGNNIYTTLQFEKDVPYYLSYVPTIDGVPTPVTAWSTEPNGKGTLYLCREDGRSERAIPVTEDTTLYAVTGKVYNYKQQLWFDTLYDAVRNDETGNGDTLIVYRDTEEPYNIWFNKSLYVIASGDRTVKWKDGATVDSGDYHRLDNKDKEKGELVGCMCASGYSAVTLTFGRSDVSTLSMDGSSLTFDANQQSRVISLGSGATFHMYDGITLTNGERVRAENLDENSDTARASEEARSYYGGGVYAGLNSAFYMHGGTISHCSAYKGGGVYLYANKNVSTPGSKMYMGDMVTPTAYSATAIYYTEGADGFYVNAPERVTAENYKNYYVTTGSPEICYNTATREFEYEWANDDGGGGLLMLDVKDGDLVLYKGRIHNNTAKANGGGIVSDGGDTQNGVDGNNAKLRIYEVDVSHNTAIGYGGGIFQWQGVVYIYNSTLRQNSAGQSGGGIYLHHYSNPEKSTVEFHYGDIADNRAGANGGGVYVEDYQNMTIGEGNLVRNSAGWDGGGVYVANNGNSIGELLLKGGTVADNTAHHDGGGVYSTGAITMSGGTLSGNTAGNDGGGIYYTGSMTMSGGTVCENSATYLGGGILVDGTDSKFNLSGGNLYGNTDTDYPTEHQEDEDNVNPGPNDIYLKEDNVITIPEGGIALSGEERVAVDCERDESIRFPQKTLPYRFVKYAKTDDFKESDAWYFTYYGSRSTKYWTETQKKQNLTVVSHKDLEEGKDIGLYFKEGDDAGKTTVTLNLNYPECPGPTIINANVNDVLKLNEIVPNATRSGYYLAGWARTPDAVEEQYVLYYDVVANKWRSGFESGNGWKKEADVPEYTVQDLHSQTLYAIWRPCVVVYDVGKDAKDNGVTMQSASVGPRVTILNPNATHYTVGDKTYYFQYWKDKDENKYTRMQQLDLTENLRLEAVWKERTADSVLITFYFNGGTSDQNGELNREVLVKKGDSYPIDVEIHQANKIHVGWSTSPDGNETQYGKKGTIRNLESDLKLYAVWKEAVTLTYNFNGGIGEDGSEYGTVDSVEEGASVSITDRKPTREGYTFLGWAEDPKATEVQYKAGDNFTVNQDTTLYAVWEKVEPPAEEDYTGGETPGKDPAENSSAENSSIEESSQEPTTEALSLEPAALPGAEEQMKKEPE